MSLLIYDSGVEVLDMKRCSCYGLFCLLILCIATSITANDKMIISGHPDYPPITWQEGDQIVGVGAKLFETICQELKIPYENRAVGPWKRVQEMARLGKIDLILCLYKNKERETYLEYSKPYIKDPTSIIVPKNKAFKFSGPTDLVGKRGITMHGDSFGDELDKFIKEKLTVHRAYNVKTIFNRLVSGNCDYIIWGYYPCIVNARRYGYLNEIEVLPKHIVVENIYVAFSKHSNYKKYLPQVNAIIERLSKSGKINEWVSDYLSYYHKTSLSKSSTGK